jgi:hypothetical protein
MTDSIEQAHVRSCRWRLLFKSEQDVINSFRTSVEKALATAASIGDTTARQSFDFALKKFSEWEVTVTKPMINIFLSPAVVAAAALFPAARLSGEPIKIFTACNIFGEMAKFLFGTNRQRYQGTFELFVLEASLALSDLWSASTPIVLAVDSPSELAVIEGVLASQCIDLALSSYYDGKTHRFLRAGRPDTAMRDRVMTDALVRHFDSRLRHLLQSDRPKVREYARANMPPVYKLHPSEKWGANKRKEWEQLLADGGYEDIVRFLKDMGDLVNLDEVGQVLPDRQSDIVRAAAANDMSRVVELLSDSAKEIRAYLFRNAQDRLVYREPAIPILSSDDRKQINSVQKLARNPAPDSLKSALAIMQRLWERNINNLEVRDWVAYLQARTENIPSAEQILHQLKTKRGSNRSFATEWNLAVLEYERGREKEAYSLLLPLLDEEKRDEDLISVVLALSIKLDDGATVLRVIPRTLSIRFHPLAIGVAHQLKDSQRTQDFVAQLFGHWQGHWELPPVAGAFSSAELETVVNKAIVEGQVGQVIPWLEAKIGFNRNWIPPYIELARVLEHECQQYDDAFLVLRNRAEVLQKREPRDQRLVDDGYRDLFDFCKRRGRGDLGKHVFEAATKAGISADLMTAFEEYSTHEENKERAQEFVPPDRPEPERRRDPVRPPSTPKDPALPDRVVWATARVTSIRNLATYGENRAAIEELSKLISEMSPEESAPVAELIRSSMGLVDTFIRTPPESRDARAVLYARLVDHEARLNQTLESGVLSSRIGDVLVPFRQALNLLVGDLARQAGVGPSVDVLVENKFLSLGVAKSVIVLRVMNTSERTISDIGIEAIPDSAIVRVRGDRTRRLTSLKSRESTLLNISVELERESETFPTSVSITLSVRASADGFPDADLGIRKVLIPVKAFAEVVGAERVPRLFQIGRPLLPTEPGLFQGRDEVLQQIRDSFYGGMQRERYFLDGIRRVGKTSILNFLPASLPPTIMPVVVNMEKLEIRGAVNSGAILHGICALVAQGAVYAGAGALGVPAENDFQDAPGKVFESFLSDFEASLPGRTPFLMIDEFQELLEAIARTGTAKDRETLVLDQIRANLEEGRLNALFTGSVRFDRLTEILEHRIFGSLTRLRVSFLSEEGVGRVVRAGLDKWASIPDETIRHIHALSGGYPWLTQIYGANLVDILNREQRTIGTPEDIDRITAESIVNRAELFEFWWPRQQLGIDEERLVETLLTRYPGNQPVSTKKLFSEVAVRDRAPFRRAFENLRACEILDSTQNEFLMFSGLVLRRWLEEQLHEGHLLLRNNEPKPNTDVETGQAGVFIDHENLIKTLERISRNRGVDYTVDRSNWFQPILQRLVKEAEGRIGKLHDKVTVAFWNRPTEAPFIASYFGVGFTLAQPEAIKLENAVDFKVADEVRRARERAMRERDVLKRVIVVSGDGDLSHAVKALFNDGVAVQVWGGSKDTGQRYIDLVGERNFTPIDDVCGL